MRTLVLSLLMRSAKGRAVTLIFILFLISSCTLYKKPETPSLQVPSHFKYSLQEVNAHLKDTWWENFQDKQLNGLVNEALHNNYNYQVAIKNIEIAKTYIMQNKANFLPQVNLGFDGSRNKAMNVFRHAGPVPPSPVPRSTVGSVVQSDSDLMGTGQLFNLQQLSASVSYEVDIWNQVGNSVHQAEANAQASLADSNVIKLTLISDIVNTYFQVVTLDANLRNLKEQWETAREIWQLAQAQYKSGLTDFNLIEDAKTQMENIHIILTNLTKQRQSYQNTLAYLTGGYPETFTLKTTGKLPGVDVSILIPNGLPSKMVANRPDIQEAWFQMMAYGYLEKQTMANFLPSFSLTGSYGYASQMLAHLISTGNAFWAIGANVMEPVFDYHLRKSERERAKLQFQSAILTYKNTVLNAFNEVNTALVSWQGDHEALLAEKEIFHNTRKKLELARSEFQSGLIDHSSYLALRLAYLQSQYNLFNQRLAAVEDVTQLYKTLGIGLI
jgi:multidrug efflux system outer membrane protein